jgi:sugar phosphate isomerase/epimerase
MPQTGLIRSSITLSLVEEARGGPFVLWHNPAENVPLARTLGFDAIELFPPGPDGFDLDELKKLLRDNGLATSAVATGAGWVCHKLLLAHPEASVRLAALSFVQRMIDLAADLGAPAIIGSMQGRWSGDYLRADAQSHLRDALNILGEHARQAGRPLFFEPLNRYETNMINTLADGLELIRSAKCDNVKLLGDLFHMNIEECDIPAAIRSAGVALAHIHFVDSNRHPADRGHLDFPPVVAALRQIEFTGYAAAEALPIPDPRMAARHVIEGFRKYFS